MARPSVGVVVIGATPPPTNGASRVTQQVLSELRTHDIPHVHINTAVSRGQSAAVYHLRRAAAHLGALVRLAGSRRQFSGLYLAGVGGASLWYYVMFVTLGRILGFRTAFHHHSFGCIRDGSLALRLVVAMGGPHLSHIVLCDAMQTILHEKFRNARQTTVCSNAAIVRPPSGLSVGKFRQERTDEPWNHITLGHFGNLSLEKGLAEAFDTAVILRDKGVDVTLIVAGPGSNAASEEAIEHGKRQLGSRMIRIGAMDPALVYEQFFSKIDIFLFPSRYRHEAEPLVVLEAASAAVPTVAISTGCVESIVHAPDFALSYRDNFPARAAGVILELVRNSGVGAARKAALETYLRSHRSNEMALRVALVRLAGA